MSTWRPTKDSANLLLECQKLLNEYSGTITLRQLFYLLVADGHLDLNETAYRKVKNLMINARKSGRVPPTTFSSNTRSIDDSVYGDVEVYLRKCLQDYRIPRTFNQPNHIEVWVERDPHRIFVQSLVQEYDIPVYVTGGYSSFSFVFESAKRIEMSAQRSGSPRILYFSDFSPASLNMFESQVSEISSHLSLTREEVDAIMLRVGLEPEHLVKFNLPVLDTLNPSQKTILFEKMYSDVLEEIGYPRIPVIELESLNPIDFSEIITNVLFSLTDHKVLEEVAIIEDRNKQALRHGLGSIPRR